MKRKGNIKKNVSRNSGQNNKKNRTGKKFPFFFFVLLLLSLIAVLALVLPIFLNGTSTSVESTPCKNSWVARNSLTLADIQEQVKLVTVKISGKSVGGSGIIVARSTIADKLGYNYTILTNRHVLSNDGKYKVKMPNPNPEIYDATVVNADFNGNDLALLQVVSPIDYNTVTLAPKNAINSPQDVVYAGGFPYDSEEVVANRGNITQVLSKSFEKGYQIGYTNSVKKGMSGGPILNKRGELIGINGIIAYPVFEPKYVFDDGTVPNEEEQKQLTASSWGIPILTAVSSAPESFPSNIVREVNLSARQSTVFINNLREGEKPNSGGSGVIISKEGDTYTVLTAAHVLVNSKDPNPSRIDQGDSGTNPSWYQILTSDGQCHNIDGNIRFPNKSLKAQKYDPDLASFKFRSKASYSVAKIAQYNLADYEYPWVFVSGYHPTKKQGISRPLNPGILFSRTAGQSVARNSESQVQGYELVYTNQTQGGMSGGAVLDTQGRLIGIHGSADGIYYKQKEAYLGYSFGIPIGKFLAISEELGVTPFPVKE